MTQVVDLREGGSTEIWQDNVSVELLPLVEYATPTVATLDALGKRVGELLMNGHTVLVHCRAGVQRAPLVACATLMHLGWPMADAVRIVRERRRDTAISEAQLGVLKDLNTSNVDAPASVAGK